MKTLKVLLTLGLLSSLVFSSSCRKDCDGTPIIVIPPLDSVANFEIIKIGDEDVANGGVDQLTCADDPCQKSVLGSSANIPAGFYISVYVRGFGSGQWFFQDISTELDQETGNWTRVIQLGSADYPPQGETYTVIGVVSYHNLDQPQYHMVENLDLDLPAHRKTDFVTIKVAN